MYKINFKIINKSKKCKQINKKEEQIKKNKNRREIK